MRAVVPRSSPFDSYREVAYPEGVAQDGFIEAWAAMNWHLDGHPERATIAPPVHVSGSVRPVDGDVEEAALRAAEAEHSGNWDLWADGARSDARQDPLPDWGQGTPYARVQELRQAAVPTWLWSGWYDGGYAESQLAQLADPDLNLRVTIGPLAHGAAYVPFGDPLQPALANMPMAEQVRDIAGFLRDPEGSVAPKRLRY